MIMQWLRKELDAIEYGWSKLMGVYLDSVPEPEWEEALFPPARFLRALLAVFVITGPFALAIGNMQPHGGIDAPQVLLQFLVIGFWLCWLADIGLLFAARRHKRRQRAG